MYWNLQYSFNKFQEKKNTFNSFQIHILYSVIISFHFIPCEIEFSIINNRTNDHDDVDGVDGVDEIKSHNVWFKGHINYIR